MKKALIAALEGVMLIVVFGILAILLIPVSTYILYIHLTDDKYSA